MIFNKIIFDNPYINLNLNNINKNCYDLYKGTFLTYSLLKDAEDEEKIKDYLMRKDSDKKEFILGSFIHNIILEPEKITKKYILNDSETKSINGRKFEINIYDWSLGEIIKNSFSPENNKHWNECSFFLTVTSEKGNVFYIKGKIDQIIFLENNKIKIRDLKTTFSLNNLFNLNSLIYKYSYDLQAFMYFIGAQSFYKENLIFFELMFLEKILPWRTKNFICSKKILKNGEEKFIKNLTLFEDFLIKHKILETFSQKKIFEKKDFI